MYRIVIRGINKQIIFEDEEDSKKYLHTLLEYKDKGEYKIYAYCLMGNHIHILMKEEKEDLGITMRRIGASYVYWYNWSSYTEYIVKEKIVDIDFILDEFNADRKKP
ncbi:transposase [Alkaliphilus metalliredigens]|uniref:transposase n=1 Tax=Alkaliphilus metalliredigens TaxID=208226 RepID=UPI002E8E1848|nr:transposase [Alkaliphilus metalliredigens]